MKNVLAVILSLWLIPNSFAQQNHSPTSYLWKVYGEDFIGTSYLFGSIHVNDERVFNFDDSLYDALSSCQQFASEVDAANLDSIIISAIGDQLLARINEEEEAASEEGEGAGTEEDDNSLFDELNPHGKPTLLDWYLYRAAMNLNLSSHGLENTDDQIALAESLQLSEMGFSSKSFVKEKFIDAYTEGNKEGIEALVSLGAGALDMDNRNVIQSQSFKKLAQKGPTFAVVGLGHLLGPQNVLVQLEEEGYTVEQVERGSPSQKIDSLYAIAPTPEWFPIEDTQIGVSLLSNTQSSFLSIDNGSVHFSIEMDKGLIYITAVYNTPGLFPAELLENLRTELFPDTTHLEVGEMKEEEGKVSQDFSSYTEEKSVLGRLSFGKTQLAVQMVVGFAQSSLTHPHASYYLNSLEFHSPESLTMNAQYSERGTFDYLLPDDIPFVENNYQHPAFPNRGEALILYKSSKDPISGDEYLVKYNTLPDGVTYINPYTTLQETMYGLAQRFQARDSLMINFFDFQDYLAADLEFTDSLDNGFYLRSIVKGASAYLLLQKSPGKERNTSFFDAFKLKNLLFEADSTFSFPAAQFSIKSPPSYFAYPAEDEEVDTENFSMNLGHTGAVLELEFEKVGPYDEVSLADSLFSLENMLDTTDVDSLLSYKILKYKGVCPGYFVQYTSDSSYLYQTEFEVYCNAHRISMQVIAPTPYLETDLIDQIWESVEIQVDSNSLSAFSDRKAEKILADLYSKDSTTFAAAAEAYNGYTDFKEENLPQLFDLLQKDLWGEELEENVKYGIVTDLHTFTSSEVEEVLEAYYPSTTNTYVRHRILESFAMRESESSINRLFKLLDQRSPEEELSQDLLTRFRDSLELLDRHYVELKALAEKDILQEAFLDILVQEMSKDTVLQVVESDSSWIRTQMLRQIDRYIQDTQTDSFPSIDTYIMDYLLVADIGEKEKELSAAILGSSDVFGKYRVAHKKLKQGEQIPDSLLSEVMDNDYYRYWLSYNYSSFERSLPAQYADKKDIARVVMKNYVYDELGYWCDSCTLIREVSDEAFGKATVLFIRCEAEEAGSYYLGCVGLFDENGRIDLTDDNSGYYNYTQTAEDPETHLGPLLDYIKSQLE